MKFIEQSVELIPQPTTIEEAYKLAELAGRVSYMSHDSITEDSYKKFIENMKKNKHLSVLEFIPVYLKFNRNEYFDIPELDILHHNEYTYIEVKYSICYITSNYRVLLENGLEHLMDYWVPPTEHHIKRVMFKIVTNRGVSAECNRHRKNSILESSSRYCNYSKDKFGNELTFTYPSEGFDKEKIDYFEETGVEFDDIQQCPEAELVHSLRNVEDAYMGLIKKGIKPQYARHVLPLLTATTLYHSAIEEDWKHFIELRSAKNAHPDIQVIANKIAELL